MKNKFEALKAFIDWPADWQRLCLLVFAEGYNEPETDQLLKAEPVRDCIDQGEMKLEPMPVRRAAAKKIVPINRRDSAGFTLDELKYAKSGIELGVKPCLLAEDMAGRFGRTKKAFQNYISLIQRNGIDETTGRKKPLRSES